MVNNLLITCGLPAHKTTATHADIKWTTPTPFLFTVDGLLCPVFSATY